MKPPWRSISEPSAMREHARARAPPAVALALVLGLPAVDASDRAPVLVPRGRLGVLHHQAPAGRRPLWRGECVL